MLPQLHSKTFYKAAQEYSIIDKDANKSTLNDENREIAKQVEDATFIIQTKMMKLRNQKAPQSRNMTISSAEGHNISLESDSLYG